MGTYEKGILGPFSGTVGTVVGANWRGKNVMRSRPKKSNRIPSEIQLLQRERFAMVNHFLTPLRELIKLYFGHNIGAQSRYNLAVSYHMKEAVEWVDDVFEPIFSKVMFAKGDLPGVQDPGITAEVDNKLNLSWTDNSGQGLAKANDTLIVVVYSDKTKIFEIFKNVATREEGHAEILLPKYLKDLEAQCWTTFVSNERKLAATSMYLGEITIK